MDRRDFLRRAAAAGLAPAAAAAGATAGNAATAGSSATAGSAAAATPEAGATATATSQFGRGFQPGRRSDAWVGLHVPNLRANLDAVRARAGGRPVMAVVKSNAYGHGLVPVAEQLAEAGVDAFMVANTQEAVAIKDAEIAQPVMNIGPITSFDSELIINRGIEQTIHSQDAISGLVAAVAMQQKTVRVHVHIDTGLGRMGVPWRDASELLEYIGSRARVEIAGVSTVFTEDPEFDVVQLRRFNEICGAAEAAGIALGRKHAASSAALMSMPEAHLDMVRPGIALYGHYPSEESRQRDAAEVPLLPVLSLRCRVAMVKELRQGESVGYHQAYVAPGDETVAILPIGYSDGLPPELVDGGGYAWIRGAACPYIGAITSNHSVVKLPRDFGVSVGEVATLIASSSDGEREAAADSPTPGYGPPLGHVVAAQAGVSIYRLHTQISAELPRNLEGVRRRRF